MTDTAKICAALRTPCNSCAWHEEPADRCETCRLLVAVAEALEAAAKVRWDVGHLAIPEHHGEAALSLAITLPAFDEAIRRAKEACQ